MFITLEADYAVRIVSVLCRERDKMDAKTISNDACVTLRFALKILRKLVAADIVKSYKGTQGGYIINKDPAQLTLKDVLEAIEGTYYFSCVLLLIYRYPHSTPVFCPGRFPMKGGSPAFHLSRTLQGSPVPSRGLPLPQVLRSDL